MGFLLLDLATALLLSSEDLEEPAVAPPLTFLPREAGGTAAEGAAVAADAAAVEEEDGFLGRLGEFPPTVVHSTSPVPPGVVFPLTEGVLSS